MNLAKYLSDIARNWRRADALAASGLVVGMLLVAAAPLARQLFPAQRAWTAEQAAQLSAAQAALHMYGDFKDVTPEQLAALPPKRQEDAEAYRAAVAAYERLGPQLEAAQARPDRMALVVKWAGIVLASVAGIAYLARREAT